MSRHAVGRLLSLLAFCLLVSVVGGATTAGAACDTYSPVYEAYYDEFEAKRYHQFLPKLPERHYYWTQHMQVGNPFDDGDGDYEIALVCAMDTRSGDMGHMVQAYILACTRRGRSLKLHRLFKVYDEGEREGYRAASAYHVLPDYTPLVQAEEETIRDQPISTWDGFAPNRASIDLVDLTCDGIPQVFLDVSRGSNVSTYYVRVFSYDAGELIPLFQAAGISHGSLSRYGDTDQDGRCEILLPARILFPDFGRAAYPADWVSTYEWTGERFALDNAAFYTSDTASLEENLRDHRNLTERLLAIKYELYLEDHEFQIGMIYYYKDDLDRARHYLERVGAQGEDEHYVATAKAVLAAMGRDGADSQTGLR